MPPLRLFGRSWHISSDDLALPGIAGILFHGTWSALVISQVAVLGLPDDCPERGHATASVLWLLASFLLTTLLQIWVTAVSMRGGMLEEHKRASMPAALYCLLSAYLLEAAALSYTTLVFFALVDRSHSCYTAAELARSAISDQAMQRWFIYSTWGALGVVGGLVVLLYNLYPDRNLDAWVSRVTCLSYALCCWRSLSAGDDRRGGGSSATPTVLRLAKVLGDVFFPLNFSFTDTVAAIALVGITHRSRSHRTGSSSHSHALIAAAAAGVFGPDRERGLAGAVAAMEAAATGGGAGGGGGGGGGGSGAPSSAGAAGAVAAAAALWPAPAAGEAARGGAGAGSGSGRGASRGLERAGDDAAAAAPSGVPSSKSHHLLHLLLFEHHGEEQQQQQQQQRQQEMHRGWLRRRGTGSSGDSSGAGAASVRGSELGAAAEGSGSKAELRSLRGSFVEGKQRQSSGCGSNAGSPASSRAVASPSAMVRLRSTLGGLRRASSEGAGARSGSSDGGGGGAAAGAAAAAPAAAPPPLESGAAARTTEGGALPPTLPAASGSGSGSAAASSASGYDSAWGRAVLQASALAVAPGRASRQGSGALGGPVRLAAQGQSTDAGASGSSCVAQSWAGFLSPQGSAGQLQPLRLGRTQGSWDGLSGSPTARGVLLSPADSAASGLSAGGAAAQPAPLAPHGSPGDAAPAGGPAAVGRGSVTQGCPTSVRPPLAPAPPGRHPGAACSVPASEAPGKPPRCHAPPAAAALGAPGPPREMAAGGAEAAAVGGAWDDAAASPGTAAGGGVLEGTSDEGVPLWVLEEALHWHRYALAIYGWPMFLWSHRYRALRCCRLCCGRCFSCVSSRVHSRASSFSVAGTDTADATAVIVPAGADAGGQANGGGGAQLALRPGGRPVAEGVEGGGAAAASSQGGANTDAGRLGPSGQRGARQQQQPQQSAAAFSVDSSGATSSGWDLEQGGGSTGRSPAQRPERQQQQHGSKPAGSAADSMAGAAEQGGDDAACCGGCLGGTWGPSHVPKMAPLTASQRLTREAIIQTAKIPDAALLHVNYHNLVEGLLPYSVALDEGRRCVVLAIRGSLSVEDCVTDVLYDPAPLDQEWLQPGGAKAAAAAAAAGGAPPRAAAPGAAAAPAAPAPCAGGPAAALDAEPPAPGAGAAQLLPPASAAGAAGASNLGGGGGGGSDRLAAGAQQPQLPSPFASAAAAAALAHGADARLGEGPLAAAGMSVAAPPLPSVPRSQAEAAAAAAAAAASNPDGALGGGPPHVGGPLLQQHSLWDRLRLPWRRGSSDPGADGPPLLPTTVSVHYTSGGAAPTASPPPSPRRLRHTSSQTLPGVSGGRQQLQPAGGGGAQQRWLSQVRRTTAADRALGAARAGHKFAPMTCTATDPTAAAAAAAQRSQQQLQHSGPVSRRSSQLADSATAAEALSVGPDGLQQQQQEPAQGQGLGGALLQLSAPAGMPAPLQQQPAPSHGGHRRTLRQTLSEFGHLGAPRRQQQQQQQQQQRQEDYGFAGPSLLDGGPTDRSLLAGAVAMTPSATAATHLAPPRRRHTTGGAASTQSECEPWGGGLAAAQQQQALGPAAVAQGGGAAGPAGATAAPLPAGVPVAGVAPPGPGSGPPATATSWLSSLGPRTTCGTDAQPPSAAAEAEADAAAAAAQAAAAEETPDTGAAGSQWFAHEGILNCARAIRDDLAAQGLLDALLLGGGGSGGGGGAGSAAGGAASSAAGSAKGPPSGAGSALGTDDGLQGLPNCRGWTLLLTGHSLGAGVAALLALHYRCIYPRVRVWCFAPPGGLMSPAAAASLKDICTSLVSGKDMIPRLSLWTIERLRDEMMLCAIRCKMPKLKLLLGAALGRAWEEEEVLRPLEELTAEQAWRYRAYRRAVEQERSLDPLRVRIAREFIPPGHIIWLERTKEVRERPRLRAAAAAVMGSAPAAAAGAAPAAARSLSAVVGRRTVTRLQPHDTDGLSLIVGGMVVSRNMFMDHVPDTQLAQLKRMVRKRQAAAAAAAAAAAGAAASGGSGGGGEGSAAPPPAQAMPPRQAVVSFAV